MFLCARMLFHALLPCIPFAILHLDFNMCLSDIMSKCGMWCLQGLYDAATPGSASSPPPPTPPPPPPPAGAAPLTDADCANNPTCYYTTVWNKKLEYLFIYHFFGLLWTNQFIVAFGYSLVTCCSLSGHTVQITYVVCIALPRACLAVSSFQP